MIPLKVDITYIIDYGNVLSTLDDEVFDIDQQMTCPDWWVDDREKAHLTARRSEIVLAKMFIGDSS